MSDTPERPASYSKTTITELMIPSYANFGGKIHGGILLSLMDKVAYACSSKHAGTYCVTVSVDKVNFLQPVEVGDLVSLHAAVNYVGRTSLVIGIKIIAENVKEGHTKHTNSSYFTMVAKDDVGQPCPVPGLILETMEDVRRFVQAIKRRTFNQDFENRMKASEKQFMFDDDLKYLEGQRCKLRLAH
ncbi:MAG: acyl-CoA thioesterase [Cyclobacteriaceae bacterium]